MNKKKNIFVMNVEEFLSMLDALRYDDSLDEQYPELRGLVSKVYPYIRKIYNIMYDADMLTESVNESHGNKKHNAPKDELSAIRKGNRDGQRDVYGDGFKSGKKIHKSPKMFNRKSEKINVNNFDKFVDEGVVKISESQLLSIISESIKNVLKK